jgi:hypothetical protein
MRSMSILLCLAGLWMIYWSWRVIARIEEKKVNRRFRSWFSERMSKADAEGYRIVNGVLFALAILSFGVLMVIMGIVGLFK